MGRIKKTVCCILPFIIVAAGIILARYFMVTKPKAGTKVRAVRETLVTTMTLRRADHVVTVFASGIVEPARAVDILPQVSGIIVEMNDSLIPGGFIAGGETIACIDPADFELAVEQKRAGLIKAEHDLTLELGEQAIAYREYELLKKELSPREEDMVLRRPQLELAEAELDSARAALEEARLDLERTRITAPFDALVQEKFIDPGGRADTSSPIVRLLGIDEYWVRLSLPVDDLAWLEIPMYNSGRGSMVRIYHRYAWGEESFREGEIIRLSGELLTEGRMAQVLVRVEDPMCFSSDNRDLPHILIGMYVDAECSGITLRQVVSIPRDSLREGNRVWLMNDDNQLEIRQVKVVWRNREYAFIEEGLEEGERLIISDLAAPVAGIALRVEDSNKSPGDKN